MAERDSCRTGPTDTPGKLFMPLLKGQLHGDQLPCHHSLLLNDYGNSPINLSLRDAESASLDAEAGVGFGWRQIIGC